MTVTTTYSLGTSEGYALVNGSGINGLGLLDLTSLSGGGIAFAGDHVGYGHVDVGFGGPGATSAYEYVNALGANGALDQLKSGDIAVVSENAGNIYWETITSAGSYTGFSGNLGVSAGSNADVAALTGGKFVIAYQYSFGGTDNDIEINMRSPTGVQTASFAVDGSTANDQNASVAGLRDGGFAVAWERNTGSATEAWSAIYNSDGSVRVAAHAADTAGADNNQMSVVGLAKGGYAVAYTDSGWTGTDAITVAIYKAGGQFVTWVDVSIDHGTAASEPSLTVLQDGTLAVSWTQEFSPSDHDIYMQLLDPKTGDLLLPSAQIVTTTTDNEHGSSITALGDGQVLVGWYDDTLGAEAQSHQLYVDREGDSGKNHIIGSGAFDTINGLGDGDVLKGGAGDDTIDGGDGKDAINGQAGSDLLTGGTGRDTFQFSDISDISVYDIITDLEAKDRINLTPIDADVNTTGNQAFHIVGSFTGHAGEMTIDYNVTAAGYTAVKLDVNGDGVADGLIYIQGDHSDFTNYAL